MGMSSGFPNHLLDSPPTQRVAYFRDYTIAHPFFLEAYNQLIKRITSPSVKKIFLLYGPSGVGKTELLKKVAEKIIKDNWEKIQRDKGFIPIAGFEAAAPDSGKYDWKDHYIRALIALKEPLIKHKIDTERFRNGAINGLREPNRELRRALESALKYRRTLALLIDEAQHITFNGSAKTSNNQMNLIKSLVSNSNSIHILFGTYELFDFRNSLGQLCRRSDDIHFRRYDIRNPKEQKMFIQCLWNLQKHIPLKEEPNLIDHWKHFYQVSIGCIGLLKDLITTTYEYRLLDDPELSTLDINDFKLYELTSDQSYKLAQEATAGENIVIKGGRTSDDVAQLLGISNLGINSQPHEAEHESEKEKKKKIEVGVRNPKRDVVGE